MNSTLTSLFVKQYYKLNLGFFLLCFLIFFGIVNFHDMVYFHYSLMERAYESRIMLLLFAVWLLYGLKCLNFGLQTFEKPTNSFLYQLQEYETRKQMQVFFRLQVWLYLPALVYAVITSLVLLAKGKVIAALLIFLFPFVLLLVFSFLHSIKLNSTYTDNRISSFLSRFNYEGNRNYKYWLLQYLMAKKKRTIFGIKTGSLLLLQALITYNKDHLNFESVAFLMMGLVMVHSIIPYYLREFAEERLLFIRILPLSTTWRFLWFALNFSLLLLPELVFLLFHVSSAISLSLILAICLLCVVQLCLLFSMLYIPGINIERYMVAVSILFFVMIMSLANIPVWMLVAVILVCAAALFAVFYERWEAMH